MDELREIMKGKKHIYEILITDQDIEWNFTRDEENLLNEKVKSTFEQFEFGALAVVASSDLIFGLTRMLEINIENEQIAISVFRSEALARQWIQELRAMHDDSLPAEG